MTRKRLKDIEKDLAQEKHQAAQWFGEHAKDVPPPIESTREQVTLPSGARVDRFVSLDVFPELEETGEIEYISPDSGRTTRISVIDEGEEEFTPDRWARIERVQEVLELMEEEQADLLRRHVLWGETYNELRRAGESRQAVFQRYKRAKAAFERLWTEMYGEEL